jgi:hypothetical protein
MAKILVACEFSGIVRDAFIAAGHEALSCDFKISERPGPHYKGDVFDIINDGWDLMIAHPPCTHLASSGAAHFRKKLPEQAEALQFAWDLIQADIPRICVENPVSVLSRLRKPTQTFQPWQFGHSERKRTCLWLKNLPPLQPTKIVPRGPERVQNMSNNGAQSRNRSRTYPGVAEAMASQWGPLL